MKTDFRALFTVALAGLLTFAGAGCSAQAKKDRHLAAADKAYAAGLYDQAEIEYKNVLQLGGITPHAIGQLGLIYYAQGRLGRAVPFLRKGHELEPDNLELRLKLGIVALAGGKLDEAREAAETVLGHQPENDEAIMLLVDTARKPEDIAKARQLLQHLPAPAAHGASAVIGLGLLDLRENHLTEAEAAFQKALTLDPKSSSAYTALSALYRARRDVAKTDDAMAHAAQLSPPRSPRKLQYAQFKIQNGDLPAAKRILQEMVEQTPDYLPALFTLAEIAANEKKFDESADLVAKVLARDSAYPEAVLLSSRLKLQAGKTAKAVAELEGMVKAYPQSAQAQYQLAAAYVADHQLDKANASLAQALALQPDYTEAIVLQAGLNINSGNFGAAIAALKPVVEKNPRVLQPWLLLADAYRKQGNFDEALAVFDQIEKHFPKQPQTPLSKGFIYLQQNKKTEAREAFRQTLALSPGYPPAEEQLVNLDLSEGHLPEALKRAEDLVAANPKQAGVYLLLAKVHHAQKDIAQTENALRKAIALQPDLPEAYFMLAGLYAETNQPQKALADLQTLVTKNPNDTQALMLIGTMSEQQKDYAAARSAYEKLLAVNPKFSPALNNLAYLYSERFNELDKAFETAQKARELLPREPHVGDTLGWIVYKKGEYSWALSLLQESADQLPDSADVQFHLGMAHYMMGEEAAAKLSLERALQLSAAFTGADEAREALAMMAIDPATATAATQARLEKREAARQDDPVALARLATIYIRQGNTDKALAAYEAALKANPKNLAVSIALIRLYETRNDTAKAFDLAKAARKLAPNNPEIAHALGRLAFQTGDYGWASSLLQEASAKLPDNAAVLRDFARALYSVGRVPAAEDAMRAALQAGLPAAQADQAKTFLALTALAADPAAAVAASATVAQQLKTTPDDVPALVARATAEEKTGDTTAAKQTYTQVLDRYPDFVPAKRQLAILYAATGENNPKALDFANKARTAFPGDPELAKALGLLLYRQADYTRAASLLKESAAKRPADADVAFYLGLTQVQLKDATAAKASLQRALELNLPSDRAAKARKALADLK
jgi:tetratricopeptide (TPR) repeat protein